MILIVFKDLPKILNGNTNATNSDIVFYYSIQRIGMLAIQSSCNQNIDLRIDTGFPYSVNNLIRKLQYYDRSVPSLLYSNVSGCQKREYTSMFLLVFSKYIVFYR